MRSTGIRSLQKPAQKYPASRQQPDEPPAQMPQTLPLSPSGDPQGLIAKWAYERYVARGSRRGYAR
ncbi:MAG: hypothetical protein CV089_14050 [Nitrospira sp. WS110]|nr:hypothetical protein [Nitrospira sp. WS110]